MVRPVRPQDRLGLGDAIRTNLGAQADLQLNDGSFARIGELTTFWFVPNTRDLRLAQGTVILTLAPNSGNSSIETPNAITQAQNTAVIVRHVRPGGSALSAVVPGSDDTFQETDGRTAVMVLTDSEDADVQVSVRNGPGVSLSGGQMAIVDNDNLYLFEFDLALFHQSSPLAQGLFLDSEHSEGRDVIDPATSDERPSQPEFAGDYWLDPQFLSPGGDATVDGGWLFPVSAEGSTPAATEAEAASSDEPTIVVPDVVEGTTHNSVEVEVELTPTPADTLTSEEELPSPNQPNTENLNVPAGVIVPSIEGRTPGEVPAEPNSPPPTSEPPTGS
ncbi:MAG: FecR domain-containing protein [Leptolyngbya sp. SIOISBB]|nr:FecR domain-containing protein [Leptolyngbya sp. SIOISBB]